MRVETKEVEILTRDKVGVIDFTDVVKEFLREVDARDGLLNVYLPHTTASILLNENEEGLVEDVVELLERLVPEGKSYHHNEIDNNATAHLRSILVGHSITIPVWNGRLKLGKWQRLILLEWDGPRKRYILLTYLGL